MDGFKIESTKRPPNWFFEIPQQVSPPVDIDAVRGRKFPKDWLIIKDMLAAVADEGMEWPHTTDSREET